MKAISGILGLVLVVAVIYFVYTTQFQGDKSAPPPKEQIDLAAVRSDLLSLAQAERRYIAANGACATLEQLRQDGAVHFEGSGRRGYTYVIEPAGEARFGITAKPAEPGRADWPVLYIDESMQISTSQAP